MTLLSNFQKIEERILDRDDSRLLEMLLFGGYSVNNAKSLIFFQCYHSVNKYMILKHFMLIQKFDAIQKFENPFTVLSTL